MQDIKENPFLGLKPYERKDRKRLYGRDKDLILMKDRIFSARTTLLFAGSGVGKTSFLNAKIRPEFEGQYCVIYHNQWSGTDEPLAAVKKTLTDQLPPKLRFPSEEEGPLLNYLRGFKRASEGNGEQTIRCLLILDQFEEIFQYHAYEEYFRQFVTELSDVINTTDCNTRVLFSMREEFLGELSIFDNHIPDLFNNYYRLKCPNKLEAEEIIKRTCAVESLPIDEVKLKDLVEDLARVEKGEAGIVERAKADESTQAAQRDFVAPPYLQIACQRLWESEFGGNGTQEVTPFLSHYETGDARKMLNLFCQEKLSSLTDKERAILVEAFDFLVTKKGAKMAYELTSLAEHMAMNENVLKAVLVKLSNPASRILKVSSASDGTLWFELYHDMYGSIVDEWKRNYRLNKKTAFRKKVIRTSVGVGLVALVIILYVSIHHWGVEPRRYKRMLREADLQKVDKFQEYESAFNKLNGTFGFGTSAKDLWAEAWRRRARAAEDKELDADALLSWLQAASYSSSPKAEDQLRITTYLNDFQFASLMTTLRIDSPATVTRQNPPIFSADGRTFLTFTGNRQVVRWETETGRLLGEPSPPLQVEYYMAREEPPPRQPIQIEGSENTDEGPLFRAATGQLLAGFNKDRFFIWRIDNGSIFWSAPSGSQKGDQKLPRISLAPSGKHLGTVDAKGNATIYDLAADQKTKPIENHRFSSVRNLTFDPEGRIVYVQLRNRMVRLWDIQAKKVRIEKRLDEDYEAKFSPDGSKILLRNDETIQVVDSATLSMVKSSSDIFGVRDATLSSDNSTIVVYRLADLDRPGVISYSTSGGKYLYLQFVEITTGARGEREIGSEELSLAVLNPDGKTILTVSDNGVARLRHLTVSRNRGRMLTDSADWSDTSLTPDARMIATANVNREIKLWNTDSGHQIEETFVAPKTVLNSTTDNSRGIIVDISPNGRYVAFSDGGDLLTVRELASHREFQFSHPRNERIQTVSFGPDSRLLLTSTSSGVIRIWKNLEDKAPGIFKSRELLRFHRIEISPDAKYAAIYDPYYPSLHGNAIIDVSTMKEVPLEESSGERGWSFGAFSRASTVIGISRPPAAIVTDLASGHVVQKFTTSAEITSVAISSDGRLAMTACKDGTAQLWSVGSGKMIGPPLQIANRVSQVAFSPNDQRVIVTSGRWTHLFSIGDNGLSADGSRLIKSLVRPVPINQTATEFRVVYWISSRSMEITDFSFNPPKDLKDPMLNAGELLKESLRKLSIRFDDTGQLVPSR